MSESEIVIDLTEPEDDDWLKLAPEALVDLALSLPPGTDLLDYLRQHPDAPLAKAVLSGKLALPENLPASAIGHSPRVLAQQLERLLAPKDEG
jgi:hypothetical protein